VTKYTPRILEEKQHLLRNSINERRCLIVIAFMQNGENIQTEKEQHPDWQRIS
jgi:hypothetical protein